MDRLSIDDKRAELSAPPRATEARTWLQDSAAGEFRRQMGISVSVDHDRAEALLGETRQFWRQRYGRELDDREIARARQAAEARSIVTTSGPVISSSHQLAEIHGWGVSTPVRDRGGRADLLHAERTDALKVSGMYLGGSNGVA